MGSWNLKTVFGRMFILQLQLLGTLQIHVKIVNAVEGLAEITYDENGNLIDLTSAIEEDGSNRNNYDRKLGDISETIDTGKWLMVRFGVLSQEVVPCKGTCVVMKGAENFKIDPPYEFVVEDGGCIRLRVVDVYTPGSRFAVRDKGKLVGRTSDPAGGAGYCWQSPEACERNPNFSSGEFFFEPGAHSIRMMAINRLYDPAAAAIRFDNVACPTPEPSAVPSSSPSVSPTALPSMAPTSFPTHAPLDYELCLEEVKKKKCKCKNIMEGKTSCVDQAAENRCFAPKAGYYKKNLVAMYKRYCKQRKQGPTASPSSSPSALPSVTPSVAPTASPAPTSFPTYTPLDYELCLDQVKRKECKCELVMEEGKTLCVDKVAENRCHAPKNGYYKKKLVEMFKTYCMQRKKERLEQKQPHR